MFVPSEWEEELMMISGFAVKKRIFLMRKMKELMGAKSKFRQQHEATEK